MEQEITANNDDNELTLVPEPFLEISCPFLGVQGDAGTPMGYPTPDNHCYALKPAQHVDLAKQRRHCLSDSYSECSYFQQRMAKTAAERIDETRDAGRRQRFVNGRTLALGMMLILILLAVLIWWPPPGTSLVEGTVFGVSFNLNSPNIIDEGARTAAQDNVSQQDSETNESSSVVADGETEVDAQKPAAFMESAEKIGDVKRSNVLEKITSKGATLDSLSNEDSDASLEELESPESAPAVEEKKAEGNAAHETADAGLLNGEQAVRARAAESSSSTRGHNGFTPISYEDEGSDREMLNVYQIPGSGNYIRIARPELFTLLGRNTSSEWLKIGTENGVEGWVLVSDTELGSWIETLSEVEP
jgi:hypothetical protein